MPTNPTRTHTWDNLNTVQMRAYDATVYDGVFNKNPTLKMLEMNKRPYDGSSFLEVPIMNDTGTASAYSDYKVLNPQDNDIVTAATFEPTYYETSLSISKPQYQKNKGKGKIFDLVELKTENAIKTMRKTLATDVYGTGGTNADGDTIITGFGAQIPTDPTANPSWGSVGGIDRSIAGNAYYRSEVKAFGTGGATYTCITMLGLQQLWGQVSDDDITPDAIIVSQVDFNQIWSLADNKQRLGNELAQSLGFTSIDFNGVPIMVDKTNCATGSTYYINTDYLYFMVDPEDDMSATDFLMGTRQLAQVKYYTWSGNLVCANPRYQGKGYYV